MKEWNEYKAKLQLTLKDLEFARAPVVTNEIEYDSYVMHMSNLATLQT